tara:strand:- start:11631 stop:13832 length:2202 start_codon:yes stop_codon:yes gene_type:complete
VKAAGHHEGLVMSSEKTSSLTVAKLKALCILNDLSTSGKKSDLVERLLESGLSPHEVGMPQSTLAPSSSAKSVESEPVDSPSVKKTTEVLLSLEDEDTMEPTDAPQTPQPRKVEPTLSLDDDVLEAEILDADLVETVTPKVATTTSQNTIQKETPTTLLDLLRRPQVAATLLAMIVLGAGGYYYFDSQLDSFTADQLRYGDSMQYTISDGSFLATEEFVELVMNQLESEEDICKISADFAGVGGLSITDGGSEHLINEGSQDRKGAVRVIGGMGAEWLSVETVNTNSLSTFELKRHLSLGPICDLGAISASGSADLTVTTHKELRNQDIKATEAVWDLNLPSPIGRYQGTTMSYGVGGILGDLETLAPGLALLVQPVEIQHLFADDLITDGASGSNLGWDWRVIGADTYAGSPAWKVVATHHDIEAYCLGSATMNLWIQSGNPWAAKQTVDVRISDDDSSQSGCSPTSQLLNDYVLPEGELELHHTFQSTSVNRGQKQLDLGLNYDSKPLANQLAPSSSDLETWGNYDLHMPDDSTLRTHSFEQAIQCFDGYLGEASGASSALSDNGYVWRGTSSPQSSTVTEWNMSWVDSNEDAGWVRFNLTGSPSLDTCEFSEKGALDPVSFNRDSIPSTFNMTGLEQKFTDDSRYPSLFGEDRFFTSSGAYQEGVQTGYLIAVPADDISSLLSQITDDAEGVVTWDLSRSWDDNGKDHQLNMLADASDGRLVGWSHIIAY